MLKRCCFLIGVLLLAIASPALADGPTAEVAAPSHQFGDVGAALCNVWNMDSPDDIAWKQPNASGETVQYRVEENAPGAYGLVLRGETPQGSDLTTAFYTDLDVSIPDQTYHYFVYRAYIAPHQADEGGTDFTNGRIIYSPAWSDNWQSLLSVMRVSRAYETPDGEWVVYYFDLNRDISRDVSEWHWGQPNEDVKAFGIWPHENWANADGSPSGDSPDYFYLDYAYLTGEIITNQAQTYTVRYYVSDPDGGSITSTLYYQEQDELLLPDEAPACDASLSDWTPIPGAVRVNTLPVVNRPHKVFLPAILKEGTAPPTGCEPGFGSGQMDAYNQSFEWNLSGGAYITGKVYYVCVVTEDETGNKGYAVSSAPVIKVPPLTLN